MRKKVWTYVKEQWKRMKYKAKRIYHDKCAGGKF